VLTLRSETGWPDIPVDHPTVMVGRHAQCDARLDSRRVSLRHCILTEDGGEVVVRDLGSTNGTWINGRRVERWRLKPSDEISIAHIRYRLDGAPTKQATVVSNPDSLVSLKPGNADEARIDGGR
jgi:pSer/pThr/pTyr-binding forkhead associated (FHA) protein